jgi:GMP synthase (glutamine-hydrolysing)
VQTVLLVGHDEDETFGLAPEALATAGVRVVEHRSKVGRPLPPIDGVSGIVLFGGAMNVDMTDRFPFLEEERSYVRRAVDEGMPYLGICLGAQMLARAMDRRVFPAGVREIGFNTLHPTRDAARDPVLSPFQDGDMVFHWHEDTFELPGGAMLLATGDAVKLQAFRFGERAWGVQFHLEVDRSEVELWLKAAGDDEVEMWGKTSAQILEECDRWLATQEDRAWNVFGRFAGVVRSP